MSDNMKRYLGRDVKPAAMRRTRVVEMPDLGCVVRLRELSMGEIDTLDNNVIKQLSLMIIDEDGKLIYDSPEGQVELKGMGPSVVTQLVSEALRINGMSKASVDEVLKNFDASRNGDSVIASPPS